MSLITLFEEKKRLLETFLERTREYQKAMSSPEATLDEKIDLIDELSDAREANVKLMQALDREIEAAKNSLSGEGIEKLQGEAALGTLLDSTLDLIREIQLTDQSLFLYIQNTGYEIRSQILKSLKEKEAVSKFKSQSQPSTGDEIDQTV